MASRNASVEVLPVTRATEPTSEWQRRADAMRLLRSGSGHNSPAETVSQPAEDDEVTQAQVAVEVAEERLAALEDERRALLVQQGQLGQEDAEEFYRIQKRIHEIPTEKTLGKILVNNAKIALIEARTTKGKRVLPPLQVQLDAITEEIQGLQRKANVIGEKMRPHQVHMRHAAVDKGQLVIQNGNLQAELRSTMDAQHAPVVHNLIRR